VIPVGLVFFFLNRLMLLCVWFEAVCGADPSCVEVELGMDGGGVGIQFIWRELTGFSSGLVFEFAVKVNLDGIESCVSGIRLRCCV